MAVKALFDSDNTALHGVQNETGISRRMVYYLLDVGYLIEARGMSKPEAEAIGWTKLQIVARHIDESAGVSADEFEAFLKIARVTKARDLGEALNGHVVSATTAAVFNLTKEDRSVLDDTLVAFGAKKVPSGLADKEAALMKLIKASMAES